MADEYIKRSDAINAYKASRSKDNHRTVEGSLVHVQEHNHILHILDKLPSADVVEVVRCKDCKHYASDREKGGFCKRSASPSMWRNDEAPLRPDDFCSYGERKSKPTLPETTRQTVLDSFMKGSED